MFHKESSSITTKGAKKAKDVPSRKSDRKRLLKTAERVLLLPITPMPAFAAPAEEAGNEKDDSSSSSLLATAFLQGTLSSRILHMPTGTKVTCFYRSPEEQGGESPWPYSISAQCVWMEVQQGANQDPWQVPALALLAILPVGSVPTVTVPAQVSRFLCRGADLMRAGMRSMPSAQAVARTSGIVAICIQGNPQPMAVGHLTDFQAVVGMGTKGVGVTVISTYGDDVWAQQIPVGSIKREISLYDAGHYGNAGFLNGIGVVPTMASSDVESDEEEEEEEEGAAETGESESDKNAPDEAPLTLAVENIDSGTVVTPTEDQGDVTAQVDALELPTEGGEPEPMAPEDVLHSAVCKALVSIRPKQQLPMTMAHFYAHYVLPNRPAGTTIQLKQTRYKQLGSYIKEEVEDGLLLVGPDAGKKDPMAMLVGYDRRHPDLRAYIQEQKDNPELDAAFAGPKKLVLVQLFCVPHHFVSSLRLDKDTVKAIEATSPERQGTGMLTQKEMRSILDEYVAREELVNALRPNQIQLDGPLTDALYKSKKQGGTVPAPETLTRKELSTQWQSRMETAFALVETPGNRMIQLGRGKPPMVQIEVVMRQSRKFITRLRGIEDFGVDPVQFSRDVAHRFACSASVEDQADGRAALRKGHVELVFQGNLVDELEALLLSDETLTSHGGAKGSDYFLPTNSIEVTLRKGVPARKRRGQPASKKK